MVDNNIIHEVSKLLMWGAWEGFDKGSRQNLRLVSRQFRNDSASLITQANLRLGQHVIAASRWENLSSLVLSGDALEALDFVASTSPDLAFCRLIRLTWMGHSDISSSALNSLKALIRRSSKTMKELTLCSTAMQGFSSCLFDQLISLESLRLEAMTIDTTLAEMVWLGSGWCVVNESR